MNNWKDLFPKENRYFETDNGILYCGDCLEVMDELIAKGVVVGAIITDLPYGVTACSWDSPIPFNNFIMQPKSKRSKKMVPIYRDEYILQELKKGRDYKEICEYFDKNSKEGMWQKLNKLIKPNGAIVLFGSEPFSSALNFSNIKNYKYSLIWKKSMKTGFQLAKKRPLKQHELISIFYKKQATYNPQGLKPYGKTNKRGSTGENWSELKQREYTQEYTNYPTQIVEISSEGNTKHPTQKPVALMEYLIKTYTNEGDLVLDFAMGSGTTGVACEKLNRRWIGIEINPEYCEIAKQRILGEI